MENSGSKSLGTQAEIVRVHREVDCAPACAVLCERRNACLKKVPESTRCLQQRIYIWSRAQLGCVNQDPSF
jgi:hypothetical protein